jgi:hypothetical protein
MPSDARCTYRAGKGLRTVGDVRKHSDVSLTASHNELETGIDVMSERAVLGYRTTQTSDEKEAIHSEVKGNA